MKWNSLRRVGLVLVLGAGAVVLPAAPASAAYLSGVTIVSASSASDSVAQKSASVICPDDTVVVGVGASIAYTTDEVHITGVRPSRYGVIAYASEDDSGYSYNWYLRVTAVCADAPAGYEIVSDYHVATSDPSATIAAYCSSGKVLLGGAADVAINNIWTTPRNLPDVVVNRWSVLDFTTQGFSAYAFEDENGTTSQWVLTAFAICADPIVGLQTVTSWGYMQSGDSLYEVVACPPGTKVLSAGGHIFMDTGEVSFTELRPSSYNGDDFVMVRAAEDQTGMSGYGMWRMDAWARCAPSLALGQL
jgi:hypothetical protein